MLSVQFSIKISKLSDQVKDLVQENALLRYEFEKSLNRFDESQQEKDNCKAVR
jgi:regulator of replication initiation timing